MGGDSSSVQLDNVQQLEATQSAFAAVRGDGSVVTWGRPRWGGDSSPVAEKLKDVQQVRATAGAFAALLRSGGVVTWGHPALGGDSSEVQDLPGTSKASFINSGKLNPKPLGRIRGTLQKETLLNPLLALLNRDLIQRVCVPKGPPNPIP
ncbi:HERC2 [Symbiodinium natans]|uniref:HERC2 protein n=1 Tax=Symbiodinium natans TaxID=878477 RepID=A0A812SX67_9DINO|nr:HERC2 [Symbiodinium natans]